MEQKLAATTPYLDAVVGHENRDVADEFDPERGGSVAKCALLTLE